jgi:hypothetical protein
MYKKIGERGGGGRLKWHFLKINLNVFQRLVRNFCLNEEDVKIYFHAAFNFQIYTVKCLVSTVEELLGRNSSGCGLNR